MSKYKFPEYLIAEYTKLGIVVKENCGLDPRPQVNVVTGYMHLVIEGENRLACSSEYGTTPENLWRLNSISALPFKACSRCRIHRKLTPALDDSIGKL